MEENEAEISALSSGSDQSLPRPRASLAYDTDKEKSIIKSKYNQNEVLQRFARPKRTTAHFSDDGAQTDEASFRVPPLPRPSIGYNSDREREVVRKQYNQEDVTKRHGRKAHKPSERREPSQTASKTSISPPIKLPRLSMGYDSEKEKEGIRSRYDQKAFMKTYGRKANPPPSRQRRVSSSLSDSSPIKLPRHSMGYDTEKEREKIQEQYDQSSAFKKFGKVASRPAVRSEQSQASTRNMTKSTEISSSNRPDITDTSVDEINNKSNDASQNVPDSTASTRNESAVDDSSLREPAAVSSGSSDEESDSSSDWDGNGNFKRKKPSNQSQKSLLLTQKTPEKNITVPIIPLTSSSAGYSHTISTEGDYSNNAMISLPEDSFEFGEATQSETIDSTRKSNSDSAVSETSAQVEKETEISAEKSQPRESQVEKKLPTPEPEPEPVFAVPKIKAHVDTPIPKRRYKRKRKSLLMPNPTAEAKKLKTKRIQQLRSHINNVVSSPETETNSRPNSPVDKVTTSSSQPESRRRQSILKNRQMSLSQRSQSMSLSQQNNTTDSLLEGSTRASTASSIYGATIDNVKGFGSQQHQSQSSQSHNQMTTTTFSAISPIVEDRVEEIENEVPLQPNTTTTSEINSQTETLNLPGQPESGSSKTRNLSEYVETPRKSGTSPPRSTGSQLAQSQKEKSPMMNLERNILRPSLSPLKEVERPSVDAVETTDPSVLTRPNAKVPNVDESSVSPVKVTNERKSSLGRLRGRLFHTPEPDNRPLEKEVEGAQVQPQPEESIAKSKESSWKRKSSQSEDQKTYTYRQSKSQSKKNSIDKSKKSAQKIPVVETTDDSNDNVESTSFDTSEQSEENITRTTISPKRSSQRSKRASSAPIERNSVVRSRLGNHPIGSNEKSASEEELTQEIEQEPLVAGSKKGSRTESLSLSNEIVLKAKKEKAEALAAERKKVKAVVVRLPRLITSSVQFPSPPSSNEAAGNSSWGDDENDDNDVEEEIVNVSHTTTKTTASVASKRSETRNGTKRGEQETQNLKGAVASKTSRKSSLVPSKSVGRESGILNKRSDPKDLDESMSSSNDDDEENKISKRISPIAPIAKKSYSVYNSSSSEEDDDEEEQFSRRQSSTRSSKSASAAKVSTKKMSVGRRISVIAQPDPVNMENSSGSDEQEVSTPTKNQSKVKAATRQSSQLSQHSKNVSASAAKVSTKKMSVGRRISVIAEPAPADKSSSEEDDEEEQFSRRQSSTSSSKSASAAKVSTKKMSVGRRISVIAQPDPVNMENSSGSDEQEVSTPTKNQSKVKAATRQSSQLSKHSKNVSASAAKVSTKKMSVGRRISVIAEPAPADKSSSEEDDEEEQFSRRQSSTSSSKSASAAKVSTKKMSVGRRISVIAEPAPADKSSSEEDDEEEQFSRRQSSTRSSKSASAAKVSTKKMSVGRRISVIAQPDPVNMENSSGSDEQEVSTPTKNQSKVKAATRQSSQLSQHSKNVSASAAKVSTKKMSVGRRISVIAEPAPADKSSSEEDDEEEQFSRRQSSTRSSKSASAAKVSTKKMSVGRRISVIAQPDPVNMENSSGSDEQEVSTPTKNQSKVKAATRQSSQLSQHSKNVSASAAKVSTKKMSVGRRISVIAEPAPADKSSSEEDDEEEQFSRRQSSTRSSKSASAPVVSTSKSAKKGAETTKNKTKKGAEPLEITKRGESSANANVSKVSFASSGKGKQKRVSLTVKPKSARPAGTRVGNEPWGPNHPIMQGRGKALYNNHTVSKSLLKSMITKFGCEEAKNLSKAEFKKLQDFLNKDIEERFDTMCDNTKLPYGVFTYKQIKKDLKDHGDIPKDATDADLKKLFKETWGDEAYEESEGILYPRPGKSDTADMFDNL